LTRLLNDALATHGPGRIAVSASGVELGEAARAWIGEDDRPESDVLVIDADFEPASASWSAQVFAEIVSDTDNTPVPGEKEPWIVIKHRLYLAHPPMRGGNPGRSLPRRGQNRSARSAWLDIGQVHPSQRVADDPDLRAPLSAARRLRPHTTEPPSARLNTGTGVFACGTAAQATA
jgi:hypothetical protein